MEAATLIQTIHCHHNQPRLVAEHLTVLTRAAKSLWGFDYRPDVAAITSRIEELLRTERYPATVSAFVRLTLDSSGEEQLLSLGTSLYDGYALRSLRPDCCTLPYRHPFEEPISSSALACDTLAASVACRRGYDAAIRCNDEGVCYAIADAPLFAVRDGELYTSIAPATATAQLLASAAAKRGIPLHITPILVRELSRYDELFVVDHRGITSVAHCNGHPFILLRAERLAAEMERMING